MAEPPRNPSSRNNARIVAAAVVAIAALTGIVILILQTTNSASNDGLRFATTRADSPFADFNEARFVVRGHCSRVLIASTDAQRTRGLRDVRSLGPYAGMLFVNPSSTDARFTMAQTDIPLDITFFDDHGTALDHTTMMPCPHGTDATCPTYASHRRYRYALEVPAGNGGSGPLSPCA